VYGVHRSDARVGKKGLRWNILHRGHGLCYSWFLEVFREFGRISRGNPFNMNANFAEGGIREFDCWRSILVVGEVVDEVTFLFSILR
jgi:hypothetical protein